MYVHLPQLISADDAASVIAAQSTDPVAAGAAAGALREKLLASEAFDSVAMARRVSPFTVSGNGAGPAREFPLASVVVPASGDAVRADLWVTVFLGDPDSYGGGEVVITTDTGTRRARLPAGDAVVYSAGNYRRLGEVGHGTQWLADAAIQCIVRDAEQRQILTEISQVLDWLGGERDRDAATIDQALRPLRRARSNLHRLWADV